MEYKRGQGWHWFFSGEEGKLIQNKCGKWMHFFEDVDFAKGICQKAIEEGVCYECKCSDLEMRGNPSGVICFYLNADDNDNHRRVIEFMMKNDLIKRTRSGNYHNISFKYDFQTAAGEYGTDFQGIIKLGQFVDLKTGVWLHKQ